MQVIKPPSLTSCPDKILPSINIKRKGISQKLLLEAQNFYIVTSLVAYYSEHDIYKIKVYLLINFE